MLRNLPEAVLAFSQAHCYIPPLPDNDPGMPTCLQLLLSMLDLYHLVPSATAAADDRGTLPGGSASAGASASAVHSGGGSPAELERAASQLKNRVLVRKALTLLQDIANRSEDMRGLLAWSPFAASTWTGASPGVTPVSAALLIHCRSRNAGRNCMEPLLSLHASARTCLSALPYQSQGCSLNCIRIMQ
jgi:hypothetical protein